MSTYIIAEAGVNHNGSLKMAKELIDAAKDAGADAVKFQTFKASKIASKHAGKADYQKQTTDAEETQIEMLKKLELDLHAHEVLIAYCEQQGIEFLSTPFDEDSVDLLAGHLRLPRLKMPSGEITNALLLLKAASTRCSLIVSTGMSTLGDVEMALSVIAYGLLGSKEEPSIEGFHRAYSSPEGQLALRERVSLLHCTSEYPTPFADVNLRAMDTLRNAFGLPVGLSDHTEGISIPIAAVARGATIIEKHFTLDRNLPGPDHKASLEPEELKAMVDGVREVELALGVARKLPAPSEVGNRQLVRKCLVAARAIKMGEVFTAENITAKRPGTGLSPIYFWDKLGEVAIKDYDEDEPIV